MIRAKFHCSSVEAKFSSDGVKSAELVTMHPVYADGPENKEWFRATPAGWLSMTIDNPGAWGRFEQGGEYYIDFTPAGA